MKIETDCALWVLDALDTLNSYVGVRRQAFDAARLDVQPVQQMTLDLSAGRVSACVDLLASHHTQYADRHDTLLRILVPAIHSLEDAWKRHTMDLGTLVLAFGTARHVIDVWRNAPDRVREQSKGRRGTVLVAVAPMDQHSFGAQILADDLFMRGFDVTLRTDTHADNLVDTVAARDFAAITLSFGHDGALEGAADLIARLRAHSQASGVAILAGGPALAAPFAQYSFLGADAVLHSAHEAATYIETLVGTAATRTRN